MGGERGGGWAEKHPGCNTEPPTLGRKASSPPLITHTESPSSHRVLPSWMNPLPHWPSFPSLSPLKDPPLHNLPSTLSAGHALRKAALRTCDPEWGPEGRRPRVLHLSLGWDPPGVLSSLRILRSRWSPLPPPPSLLPLAPESPSAALPLGQFVPLGTDHQMLGGPNSREILTGGQTWRVAVWSGRPFSEEH